MKKREYQKRRYKENASLQIEYQKVRYQENPGILREYQKRGTKKRRKDVTRFRIFCNK